MLFYLHGHTFFWLTAVYPFAIFVLWTCFDYYLHPYLLKIFRSFPIPFLNVVLFIHPRLYDFSVLFLSCIYTLYVFGLREVEVGGFRGFLAQT